MRNNGVSQTQTKKEKKMKQDLNFVKQIFDDRQFELRTTDGKETLAEAGEVFGAGIHGAVKHDGAGKATPKTPFAIYEQFVEGDYAKIFEGDLKLLPWKESQIVVFCKDHLDLLLKDDRGGTLFLFDEGNGLSVANVFVREKGLSLHVDPFLYKGILSAEYRHLLMSPQQVS